VNGRATTPRDLTTAETTSVSGGDGEQFLAYVGVGATIGASFGAPLGAAVLPVGGTAYGMFAGGFIGGFFGAGYYALGELVDYCF
jgi:hypothetical protein